MSHINKMVNSQITKKMKFVLVNSTKTKKIVILTKNTVMEPKNTENCTNICKLTNCRLSMLILTNEKQDEIFIFTSEAERRTQVMYTVQGWHFAEQVKRFAYKAFSGEKINTQKKARPFFILIFLKWSPFKLCSLLSFLRLTSTFYFENHTGLNVPSHKQTKKKH